MRAKKEPSITRQKLKVKQTDYNIFKDGLFDPVCPNGFNFLTGMIETSPTINSGRLAINYKQGTINRNYIT